MSAQPQAIDQKEKQLQEKKRVERRADILYVAGAALISIGLGAIRWYLAPIAAGFFAMLLPLLEVAAGFIRGLRRK